MAFWIGEDCEAQREKAFDFWIMEMTGNVLQHSHCILLLVLLLLKDKTREDGKKKKNCFSWDYLLLICVCVCVCMCKIHDKFKLYMQINFQKYKDYMHTGLPWWLRW